MSARNLFASVLCLSIALSMQGCSDNRQGPGTPQVVRLIEDTAQDIFSVQALKEYHYSFEVSFGTAGELEYWTAVKPLEVTGSSDNGVLLKVQQGPNTLYREMNLVAAEIDVITVRGRDFEDDKIFLIWRREGEAPSVEHKLPASTQQREQDGLTIARFQVGNSPSWRGDIARIGLRVSAVRSHRILVRDLRMGTAAVSENRLAAATKKSWYLDDEAKPMAVVRHGLLSPPGHVIQWEVQVPEDGHLRFGYGTAAQDAVDPILFRVTVKARKGFGSKEQELWRAVSRGDWADANVDLTSLSGQRVTLSFETQATTDSGQGSILPAWAHPEIVAQRAPVRPSLVLASIDTLRADRLSLYGNDRPTSPRIDSWARNDATTFETAIAPSSWTLPSHVSLFTGIDSHRHGVNGRQPMASALKTLAEVLREEGWRTLAVTGGGFLAPRFGLQQGFDEYTYWNGPGDHGEELAAGTRMTLSALTDLQQDQRDLGRPYYLFFHTYEVHYPYHFRQPFFTQWSRWPQAFENDWKVILPRENERLTPDRALPTRRFYLEKPGEARQPLPQEMADLPMDLYDSGIAFMDSHFGRILDSVFEDETGENTVVVLTSDHGELFGEHDLTGHTTLYEGNIRVPLIIDLAGNEDQVERVSDQVRLVDVVPTVLQALGQPELNGIDGRSLIPMIRGSRSDYPRQALMYSPAGNHGFAIREDNFKYILRDSVWLPHRGRQELYGLRDDPGENTPLKLEGPVASRLREEATRQLLQHASGLHFEFSNTTHGTVIGFLEGPSLASTLKSLDVAPDCLKKISSDRARFRVPPGVSFGLYSSQINPDWLRISVEISNDDESSQGVAEFLLTPEDLMKPQVFSWNGTEWMTTTEILDQENVPATLVVSWWGPEQHVPLSRPEAESESMEQLKALGYVE